MSRLAFFAPLKSPLHKIPSGDRELAAGVHAALSMNSMGFEVDLVSELRCYDGLGRAGEQKKLMALAEAEVRRLLNDERRFDWCAWVSYHNYYKAPDLLGPKISQVLGIPYILIEASRSQRRLTGPWSSFAQRAEAACDQAAVIFHVTDRDRVALEQHRYGQQKIAYLAPFLNRSSLPPHAGSVDTGSRLLTVAMHREGDKLASYEIIAALLPRLTTHDWHLQIVGDGPAHARVRSLFASFGKRVSFLGRLDSSDLASVYETANVFVWPGVNEAFGMVYLEAQAAGLPVVAEDRPGVREVVASKRSLVPAASVQQYAQTIDSILQSDELRSSLSIAGRDLVRKRHLLDVAATTLSAHLEREIAR